MSDNVLVEQPDIKELEFDPEYHDTEEYFKEYRVSFSDTMADIIGVNDCIVATGLDDIEAWIHEFIEMPLFKQRLFRVRNIRFSIDGDICTTTIAHLLASFTGGSSIYGRPISVEEFDHHLLANCKVSQQSWRKRYERNREESSNRIQS